MGADVSPTMALAMIETRFGVQLKRVGRGEWAGPCPFCGGCDRWHYWTDKGNWWCRPGPGHCGQKGFLDDLFDEMKQPTKEQLLEWRIQRLERRQREHEERLRRLEQMAQCTDHLRYHEALDAAAHEYWLREGIIDESIERYLLGWCAKCPTDRAGRPSYTIPVVNRGRLENIRHRLRSAEDGDKYRPHMAGLGVQLFNVDLLDEACQRRGRVIVTEGEKKSIVLAQSGFRNVGITGKRAFMRQWLKWFDGVGNIVVALDPDATESAHRLAKLFNGRARVARLPDKIDDMIVKYGAGQDDIEAYLRLARPVRGD